MTAINLENICLLKTICIANLHDVIGCEFYLFAFLLKIIFGHILWPTLTYTRVIPELFLFGHLLIFLLLAQRSAAIVWEVCRCGGLSPCTDFWTTETQS